MKSLLWALAGIAISAAIALGLYFDHTGYRLAIVSPLDDKSWTRDARYAVQDEYPGGQFALGDYIRCEVSDHAKEVWVIYRANHDVIVTDRGCWH